MTGSFFKSLRVDGILYAIVLFLAIWGTLQFDKPNIPFSTTLFYCTQLLIFCRKYRKLKHTNRNNISSLIRILLLGVILVFLKFSNEVSIWTFFHVFLVALLLEIASDRDLKISKLLFVLYIIVNCCLIFYERKTMTVLLWNSDDYSFNRNDITDLNVFRASGFTGHPVLGGFLLSIELAFIQMSKMKQSFKYIFTVLLFFALLCVNSRANIGISGLISLYLFKDALLNNKHRFIKVLAIFLCFYFFYDLITTTDFGGRLLNNESGMNDDSTMARIEILSFTDYLTWGQLLWGDFELTEYLMNVMGLAGIENGYIVLVISYGLIFGSILIILLTMYQWKALSVYPKDQRMILLMSFILIACTNPHIGNSIPWIYWVISYYLFRPSHESCLKKIV